MVVPRPAAEVLRPQESAHEEEEAGVQLDGTATAHFNSLLSVQVGIIVNARGCSRLLCGGRSIDWADQFNTD